jgi:photosystem II stability/assembly factor-like uncharacterized protein
MRWFRHVLVFPVILAALVVLPSVVFSYSDNRQLEQNSTVPGTVPGPTATATRRPYPTATPHRHGHRYRYRQPAVVTATPTATPTTQAQFDELVLINGAPLKRVIGDRLSSTIYGYTFSGWLYRSSDNGETWTLVTTTPAVDDFIMSAADPDVLYSGAGQICDQLPRPAVPLYKSTDGGVNWSRLPGGDNLRPLLAHPADADSVFAADCVAPSLSTDGGETWTARPDNSVDHLWESYVVSEMAAAPFLGDPRPTTPNWDQIVVGGLAEDGSGVVAFTADQGETWVRLTPNVFPASWGMNSLTVDAYTQGLVVFAEPRSIWQSTNYGVNWQISQQGLETVAQRDVAGGVFGLNDVVYHPNGKLYLATVRGLYVKPLDGQAWTKLSGNRYDNVNVDELLYTESNLSVLWLNTDEGVYRYQVQ